MSPSQRRVLVCLSVLAPLAGCGDDTPVPTEADAAAGIGPAGGTVFAPGLTLTVPPGALAAPTTITVTRADVPVPPGYVGYSPVWRFAPAGLTFAVPATVQVTFAGDASRAALYWSSAAGAGYERRSGVVTATTVVATVEHFSDGFVGAPATTDGGAGDVPATLDGGGDAATTDAATTDATTTDATTTDAPAPDATTIDAPAPDATTTDASTDAGTDAPAPDAPVGPAIGAPRPLAPGSLTSVSSRRPTIRWSLAAGSDGAHVDLCRNAALTTGCLAFDAAGTSAAPAADLAPGLWFWRLRGREGALTGAAVSATWHFRVGARASAAVGVLPTLDVNGDGFDDLAVGTPSANAVYVYPGSATGLRAAPLTTLAGAMGEQFGATVAGAGDVNGDGFGDLLVRAAGRVRVFLGGAAGLATTPAQSLGATGATVGPCTALGDVDRDGYGDVVVGTGTTTAVYYGSAGGLVTRAGALTCALPGGCGALVAGAGDVNGDGYADALMGSGNRLELHPGGAGGLAAAAATTVADGSGGAFASAAGLGDVNGDGYGDVVANGLLFHGGAAGLDPLATASVGSGARAGDVNGDGYDDLLMAAGSQLRVLPGSASGIRTIPLSTSSATYAEGGTAGDYDADGYVDLAANTTVNLNAVTVFPGGPGGATSTAALTLSDPEFVSAVGVVRSLSSNTAIPLFGGFYATATSVFYCERAELTAPCFLWPHALGARFGASIAYVADVDADGQPDALVGAPGSNTAYLMAVIGEGRLGATLTGPAGSGFGGSVAAADVNGDGVNDAIVGAPDAARVYVYLGGAGFPRAPVTLAGAAGSRFGRLVVNAGDLNGDHREDVAVASDDRVDVFPGGAAGVATTASATLSGAAGSRFAAAVASAGDVNHDGFGDLAVGAPGINTAYVYYGAATGIRAPASVTLAGAAGSEFGSAVLNPGVITSYLDVANDLMVGAPGADAAYVFPGATAGLGTTASFTLTGAAGSRFGATLLRDYASPAQRNREPRSLAVGTTGVFPARFYYQNCPSRGPCNLDENTNAWSVPRTSTFSSSFGASVASQ